MTTTTAAHVEPEELMALVDGELTGRELHAAEEHIASCEICAANVAKLQHDTLTLNTWKTGDISQRVENKILARVKHWSGSTATPSRRVTIRLPNWWLWCGAGALAASALAGLLIATNAGPSFRMTPYLSQTQPPPSHLPAAGVVGGVITEPMLKAEMAAPPPGGYDKNISNAQLAALQASREAVLPALDAKKMLPPPAVPRPSLTGHASRIIPADPQTTAPMIVRTVALTLTVKDVERSRQGVEELLRTYNGYAAQMEVSTPEGGSRTLRASLRVPSGQMRGMIAELKGYGKVANETQSGEEVGQQHADLVVRLNTARESEERLRGILKNRTGDVADVLQVEEEIARVRTEIESMEAEQQGLEHRVTYATVDLQMNEEGQGAVGKTIGSRLAAAASHGWDNATETVIAFLLFLLEYGLATVLILALIGLPSWFALRQWRRMRANR